jgi:transcription elongation factor Elf1
VATRKTFTPDEVPTAVTCLACGGNWQTTIQAGSMHSTVICRHCDRGSMSPRQVAAWKKRTK